MVAEQQVQVLKPALTLLLAPSRLQISRGQQACSKHVPGHLLHMISEKCLRQDVLEQQATRSGLRHVNFLAAPVSRSCGCHSGMQALDCSLVLHYWANHRLKLITTEVCGTCRG